MPSYHYKATTSQGVILEGMIDAADEKKAVERLKSSGVIPIQVAEPGTGWLSRLNAGISLKSAKKDLVTFTMELSALLGAGLPLDRSLNILADISEDREMRKVVQDVLKFIRGGSSFSDALQRHPGVFPRFYINMIRAGEAGGVLDAVLEKLNEFMESTKELKDHIFSAMIYPVILIVTGGASIILLLTFVLPRFSVIFSELGKSLPLPTQILVAVSGFLKTTWWAGLLLALAGWLAFRHYVKSDEGRYRWDALKLRLMEGVVRKLETARFCRTLGTLIQSGVPLLQSLNNAKDVIGNRVIASAVDAVSAGAKEGKGISVPLAAAGVFPPLALSMIKVGEETGQLDGMLLKVAATYERSLKQEVKKFISLFEPVMILVMGVIIGFIVISMLMAIFSITDLPF